VLVDPLDRPVVDAEREVVPRGSGLELVVPGLLRELYLDTAT